MSYTTLYAISLNGDVKEYRDFKNAFRGGFLVWDNMSERYLHQPAAHFMLSDMQPVWDLCMAATVPLAEQIVMKATFDRVMVKRNNLNKLIDALDEYFNSFPDAGHLPAQAEALREILDDEQWLGVCWNQTSVNCNPWWVYNDEDEDDEGRPYNINIDNDHWFLFDNIGDDNTP